MDFETKRRSSDVLCTEEFAVGVRRCANDYYWAVYFTFEPKPDPAFWKAAEHMARLCWDWEIEPKPLAEALVKKAKDNGAVLLPQMIVRPWTDEVAETLASEDIEAISEQRRWEYGMRRDKDFRKTYEGRRADLEAALPEFLDGLDNSSLAYSLAMLRRQTQLAERYEAGAKWEGTTNPFKRDALIFLTKLLRHPRSGVELSKPIRRPPLLSSAR